MPLDEGAVGPDASTYTDQGGMWMMTVLTNWRILAPRLPHLQSTDDSQSSMMLTFVFLWGMGFRMHAFFIL